MAVVVQKFGGTSLADPSRIIQCASRAVAARGAGHRVVVVVSAMGDATNELISS
jgi:aspartate kinase